MVGWVGGSLWRHEDEVAGSWTFLGCECRRATDSRSVACVGGALAPLPAVSLLLPTLLDLQQHHHHRGEARRPRSLFPNQRHTPSSSSPPDRPTGQDSSRAAAKAYRLTPQKGRMVNIAPVKWAQRSDSIYATICLPDVVEESIELDAEHLTFKCVRRAVGRSVVLAFAVVCSVVCRPTRGHVCVCRSRSHTPTPTHLPGARAGARTTSASSSSCARSRRRFVLTHEMLLPTPA